MNISPVPTSETHGLPCVDAFANHSPNSHDFRPQSKKRLGGWGLLGAATVFGLAGCAGPIAGISYHDQYGTHSVPSAFLGPIQKAASYCPKVDVKVITAQILRESSFDSNANSGEALGASQFTKDTWLTFIPAKFGKHPSRLDEQIWLAERTDISVEVPIEGKYLCELVEQHGSLAKGLEAYYGSFGEDGEAYAQWIHDESATVRVAYASKSTT